MFDLVLATALEADGLVPSLRECRDNCKTLWGFDVELDEIREILEGMVAAGSMSRTNGRFTLEPAPANEFAAGSSSSPVNPQRGRQSSFVLLSLRTSRPYYTFAGHLDRQPSGTLSFGVQ